MCALGDRAEGGSPSGDPLGTGLRPHCSSPSGSLFAAAAFQRWDRRGDEVLPS